MSTKNDTLISLSDVIIPATETPGAKEAQSIAILTCYFQFSPVSFGGSLSRLWPSSTKRARALAFKVVQLHFAREHDRDFSIGREKNEISRRSFLEAPVPF